MVDALFVPVNDIQIRYPDGLILVGELGDFFDIYFKLFLPGAAVNNPQTPS